MKVQNNTSQTVVVQVRGPDGLESRTLLPQRSVKMPEDQLTQDIVDKEQARIVSLH